MTERKGRDKDAIPIEEEYLEALIKLFEYSGKKIEEREKKDDKKRKVHEQTRLIESFVQGLDQAVKSGTFNEKELSKLISEDARKDLNAMHLCFTFLERCLSYPISQRLKSLVENLFDKKVDGWRETIFQTKGPKKLAELEEEARLKAESGPGYRRHDDHEDYYTKERNRHRGGHHHNDDDDDLYEKKESHHDNKGGRDDGYDKRDRKGRRRDKWNNKRDSRNDHDGDYFDKKRSDNFGHKGGRGLERAKLSNLHKDDGELKLTKTMSAPPVQMLTKNFDEKVTTEALVKFFKEQKTCEDLQVYKDYFASTLADWACAGKNGALKFFTAFMEKYHDCHKGAAIARAKLVPYLIDLFNAKSNPSAFTDPWSKFTGDCASEGLFGDIPHLHSSLATMMCGCITELEWKWQSFNWTWHSDPDYAEEQVYDFKDILKALVESLKKEGQITIADDVEEARKNLEAPSK